MVKKSKKAKNLFFKGTSFLLVFCFAFTTVAWSAPALPTFFNSKPQIASQIQISKELGSIEERYLVEPSKIKTNSPTIIHIQDAHAHLEAQTNIQKILKHLKRDYSIHTLFREGGFEKQNPRYYQFFKEKKYNEYFRDLLFKEGLLSGLDVFLFNEVLEKEKNPSQGYGVENEEVYRENLLAYREVISQQESSEAFIQSKRTQILSEASKYFSKTLRDFFRSWTFYQETSNDLSTFLEVLKKSAKQNLKLNLTEPRYQWEWPQLVRIYKLQELEAQVDPEKAEEEEQALALWAKNRGIKTVFLDRLKNLSSSGLTRGSKTPDSRLRRNDSKEIFLDQRDFVEKFYTEASKKGFRFEDYPEWSRWVGVQILQSELEALPLHQEIEMLVQKVFDALAKTSQEKEILKAYQRLLLLEKLLNLELSHEDYKKVLELDNQLRPSVVLSGAKNLASEILQSSTSQENDQSEFITLDSTFTNALRFYAAAKEREQVIFQNMMEWLKQSKKQEVVLVTGGFHAEGLQRLFKEKGISYVEVMPRITELEKEKSYRDLLMATKDTSTLRSSLMSMGLGDSLSSISRVSQSSLHMTGGLIRVGVETTRRKFGLTIPAVQSEMQASPAFKLQPEWFPRLLASETRNTPFDEWDFPTPPEFERREGARGGNLVPQGAARISPANEKDGDAPDVKRRKSARDADQLSEEPVSSVNTSATADQYVGSLRGPHSSSSPVSTEPPQTVLLRDILKRRTEQAEDAEESQEVSADSDMSTPKSETRLDDFEAQLKSDLREATDKVVRFVGRFLGNHKVKLNQDDADFSKETTSFVTRYRNDVRVVDTMEEMLKSSRLRIRISAKNTSNKIQLHEDLESLKSAFEELFRSAREGLEPFKGKLRNLGLATLATGDAEGVASAIYPYFQKSSWTTQVGWEEGVASSVILSGGFITSSETRMEGSFKYQDAQVNYWHIPKRGLKKGSLESQIKTFIGELSDWRTQIDDANYGVVPPQKLGKYKVRYGLHPEYAVRNKPDRFDEFVVMLYADRKAASFLDVESFGEVRIRYAQPIETNRHLLYYHVYRLLNDLEYSSRFDGPEFLEVAGKIRFLMQKLTRREFQTFVHFVKGGSHSGTYSKFLTKRRGYNRGAPGENNWVAHTSFLNGLNSYLLQYSQLYREARSETRSTDSELAQMSLEESDEADEITINGNVFSLAKPSEFAENLAKYFADLGFAIETAGISGVENQPRELSLFVGAKTFEIKDIYDGHNTKKVGDTIQAALQHIDIEATPNYPDGEIGRNVRFERSGIAVTTTNPKSFARTLNLQTHEADIPMRARAISGNDALLIAGGTHFVADTRNREEVLKTIAEALAAASQASETRQLQMGDFLRFGLLGYLGVDANKRYSGTTLKALQNYLQNRASEKEIKDFTIVVNRLLVSESTFGSVDVYNEETGTYSKGVAFYGGMAFKHLTDLNPAMTPKRKSRLVKLNMWLSPWVDEHYPNMFYSSGPLKTRVKGRIELDVANVDYWYIQRGEEPTKDIFELRIEILVDKLSTWRNQIQKGDSEEVVLPTKLADFTISYQLEQGPVDLNEMIVIIESPREKDAPRRRGLITISYRDKIKQDYGLLPRISLQEVIDWDGEPGSFKKYLNDLESEGFKEVTPAQVERLARHVTRLLKNSTELLGLVALGYEDRIKLSAGARARLEVLDEFLESRNALYKRLITQSPTAFSETRTKVESAKEALDETKASLESEFGQGVVSIESKKVHTGWWGKDFLATFFGLYVSDDRVFPETITLRVLNSFPAKDARPTLEKIREENPLAAYGYEPTSVVREAGEYKLSFHQSAPSTLKTKIDWNRLGLQVVGFVAAMLAILGPVLLGSQIFEEPAYWFAPGTALHAAFILSQRNKKSSRSDRSETRVSEVFWAWEKTKLRPDTYDVRGLNPIKKINVTADGRIFDVTIDDDKKWKDFQGTPEEEEASKKRRRREILPFDTRSKKTLRLFTTTTEKTLYQVLSEGTVEGNILTVTFPQAQEGEVGPEEAAWRATASETVRSKVGAEITTQVLALGRSSGALSETRQLRYSGIKSWTEANKESNRDYLALERSGVLEYLDGLVELYESSEEIARDEMRAILEFLETSKIMPLQIEEVAMRFMRPVILEVSEGRANINAVLYYLVRKLEAIEDRGKRSWLTPPVKTRIVGVVSKSRNLLFPMRTLFDHVGSTEVSSELQISETRAISSGGEEEEDLRSLDFLRMDSWAGVRPLILLSLTALVGLAIAAINYSLSLSKSSNRDRVKSERAEGAHDAKQRGQLIRNIRGYEPSEQKTLKTATKTFSKTSSETRYMEFRSGTNVQDVGAIFFGEGNFLRAMNGMLGDHYNRKAVILSTRGTTKIDALAANGLDYDVKIVSSGGSETVQKVDSVAAVGALNEDEVDSRQKIFDLAKNSELSLDMIFVGVTDGALKKETPTFKDLTLFLYYYFLTHGSDKKLSIINTDNKPRNGDLIKSFVKDLAGEGAIPEENAEGFLDWINSTNVRFHNTMVDRVVAGDESNLTAAITEKAPKLTMSLAGPLTPGVEFLRDIPEFAVRETEAEVDRDHALKFRVANAIHTAMVYASAVSGITYTRDAIKNPTLRTFLDRLFEDDILPGILSNKELTGGKGSRTETYVRDFYAEWIERLENPAIPHENLWIAQGGLDKILVRFLPTIIDKKGEVSQEMAFAIAVLLRFFTDNTELVAISKIPEARFGRWDDDAEIEDTVEYLKGKDLWKSSEGFDFLESSLSESPEILEHLEGLWDQPKAKVREEVLAVLALIKNEEGVSLADFKALTEEVTAFYLQMVHGKKTAFDVMGRIEDSRKLLEAFRESAVGLVSLGRSVQAVTGVSNRRLSRVLVESGLLSKKPKATDSSRVRAQKRLAPEPASQRRRQIPGRIYVDRNTTLLAESEREQLPAMAPDADAVSYIRRFYHNFWNLKKATGKNRQLTLLESPANRISDQNLMDYIDVQTAESNGGTSAGIIGKYFELTEKANFEKSEVSYSAGLLIAEFFLREAYLDDSPQKLLARMIGYPNLEDEKGYLKKLDEVFHKVGVYDVENHRAWRDQPGRRPKLSSSFVESLLNHKAYQVPEPAKSETRRTYTRTVKKDKRRVIQGYTITLQTINQWTESERPSAGLLVLSPGPKKGRVALPRTVGEGEVLTNGSDDFEIKVETIESDQIIFRVTTEKPTVRASETRVRKLRWNEKRRSRQAPLSREGQNYKTLSNRLSVFILGVLSIGFLINASSDKEQRNRKNEKPSSEREKTRTLEPSKTSSETRVVITADHRKRLAEQEHEMQNIPFETFLKQVNSPGVKVSAEEFGLLGDLEREEERVAQNLYTAITVFPDGKIMNRSHPSPTKHYEILPFDTRSRKNPRIFELIKRKTFYETLSEGTVIGEILEAFGSSAVQILTLKENYSYRLNLPSGDYLLTRTDLKNSFRLSKLRTETSETRLVAESFHPAINIFQGDDQFQEWNKYGVNSDYTELVNSGARKYLDPFINLYQESTTAVTVEDMKVIIYYLLNVHETNFDLSDWKNEKRILVRVEGVETDVVVTPFMANLMQSLGQGLIDNPDVNLNSVLYHLVWESWVPQILEKNWQTPELRDRIREVVEEGRRVEVVLPSSASETRERPLVDQAGLAAEAEQVFRQMVRDFLVRINLGSIGIKLNIRHPKLLEKKGNSLTQKTIANFYIRQEDGQGPKAHLVLGEGDNKKELGFELEIDGRITDSVYKKIGIKLAEQIETTQKALHEKYPEAHWNGGTKYRFQPDTFALNGHTSFSIDFLPVFDTVEGLTENLKLLIEARGRDHIKDWQEQFAIGFQASDKVVQAKLAELIPEPGQRRKDYDPFLQSLGVPENTEIQAGILVFLEDLKKEAGMLSETRNVGTRSLGLVPLARSETRNQARPVRVSIMDDPGEEEVALIKQLLVQYGSQVELFFSDSGITPDIGLIRSGADLRSADSVAALAKEGLKALIRMGAGVDNVNKGAATDSKVSLMRSNGNEDSVANLSLRFFLAHLNSLYAANEEDGGTDIADDDSAWSHIANIKLGEFAKAREGSKKNGRGEISDSVWNKLMKPISVKRANFLIAKFAEENQVVSLLGFGPVAQAFANKLNQIKKLTEKKFEVRATSPGLVNQVPARIEAATKYDVIPASEEEVFNEADFLFNFLPGSEKEVITAEKIEEGRAKTVFNMARHANVKDEPALWEALDFYYGDLDILKKGKAIEALVSLLRNHPDKVIITPHIAASTPTAKRDVGVRTREMLEQTINAMLGLDADLTKLDAVNGVYPEKINLSETRTLGTRSLDLVPSVRSETRLVGGLKVTSGSLESLGIISPSDLPRTEVRIPDLDQEDSRAGRLAPYVDNLKAVDETARQTTGFIYGSRLLKNAFRVSGRILDLLLAPAYAASESPQNVDFGAARRALGVPTDSVGQTLVLGPGFAFDMGLLPAVREVYPASGLVVIAKSETRIEAVSKLNALLISEGKSPIVMVRSVGELSGLLKKQAIERGVRSMKAIGLLGIQDSAQLIEALKEAVAEVKTYTSRMANAFLSKTNGVVQSLVSRFKAQFSVARSA